MYKQMIRPWLFKKYPDPEDAHEYAIRWLERIEQSPLLFRLLRAWGQEADERLRQTVGDIEMLNPVGIAGGFDKNARVIRPLEALGFGFVEVGTVTPLPQVGLPRPRIHRFPNEGALVNAMGFPNEGCEEVAKRLQVFYDLVEIPIGVNVGRGKETPNEGATADYMRSILACIDVDYVVVNVSSPNTPGIRELQSSLQDLLPPLKKILAKKPMWVKLSPDLTPEQARTATRVCVDEGARALIAGNTTMKRTGLPASAEQLKGGMSGQPLHAPALQLVAACKEEARDALDIIGVGGVKDVDGFMRMMRAGAKAVQAYTGFIYEGPGFAPSITKELVRRMNKAKVNSVAELAALPS